MMPPDPPNGSEPSWQTSWPSISEAAFLLGIPVDELRPALRNQGLHVDPETRLPFAVVEAALLRQGYTPQRLTPLSRL